MQPKLIIINGPLGSGKSTLAKMYAERHPLTLKLDIDQVWGLISGWRESPEITTPLAKYMAIAMAEIHLNAGYNVVIAQFYHSESQYLELDELAKNCKARLYEFYIDLPEQEALDRYIIRGQAGGYPDGFRPGSIVKRLGGITKLTDMYTQSKTVTLLRPKTFLIVPRYNEIEETYTELMKGLSQ